MDKTDQWSHLNLAFSKSTFLLSAMKRSPLVGVWVLLAPEPGVLGFALFFFFTEEPQPRTGVL